MAVPTDIATLSTNPALNSPSGSDLPAEIDDHLRAAYAFLAQLRDGLAFPAGMVVQFPTVNTPAGWLKLNGAVILRASYPKLFAFASSVGLVTDADWNAGSYGRFSSGDLSTNFRIPDVRGLFMRALDEARGLDGGRGLGVFQEMSNVSHVHGVNDPTHNHGDPGHVHSGSTNSTGEHTHDYAATNTTTGAGATSGGTAVYGLGVGFTGAAGVHSHSLSINPAASNLQAAATGISLAAQGGPEARPRNIAWPYYIRY